MLTPGSLFQGQHHLQSPQGCRGLGSMVPSGQAVEKPASPEPEPRSWRCLVFFLCFYGFLVQMRPGESFITPYLLGPSKNFTQKQARGTAWARAGRASGRQQGPYRSGSSVVSGALPCPPSLRGH